ncbi:MAG: DUF418 domain-containing protein [Bacteroidetes bacterium]|nr:MAG: DUF418 domain-containing protein [Bacteroidota bacterium]
MSSPTVFTPTTSTERIAAIDIIRGIALLGILMMNVVGFGLYKAYSDPTNNGGATGWNLIVWWMNNLFFEGTMRGMFSMLFGAGILIFTARQTKDLDGSIVTDLFFRRLLWMVLFGAIHCYLLLWIGDILYAYGIIGMFAFSFRHWAPKRLFLGAGVLLLFLTAWSVSDYYHLTSNYETSIVANQKKSKGEPISQEETKAIEKWDEKVKEMKATPEQLKAEMDARSKGYWSIVLHRAPANQQTESFSLYRYDFWDVMIMMLCGMAFFKMGVLKAAKSKRFYLLMALTGYAIGIPVNYFETLHIVSNQFSVISFLQSWVTYDLGRIATTCGHIGLIMLFIKSGWLPFLQKSLAAVGQMAFTNYITHTLICNVIFLGFGFSMYGKLQRYELYFIVIGIWVFQLIVSPIWLKYFRFGPLEWMWRSLTYWKKQPMLRVQPVSAGSYPLTNPS